MVDTATSAILLATIAATALLFSPRIRASRAWMATVTPLASIIGSGFLVVLPLLGHFEGLWALPSMLGIVVVAYALGAVIRFNIRFVEPEATRADASARVRLPELLGSVALLVAYLISVTFYVRILAAFLLDGFDVHSDLGARLVTTLVLTAIGVTGAARGLHQLERLEEFSVGAKLAIICGLLAGLLAHDVGGGFQRLSDVAPIENPDAWTHFRLLAGMLLVVQGFETSRYLGEEYDAETRVRTMRSAQLISGAVYVGFVALALPLVPHLSERVDETAIISVSRLVSPILPAMLVFAAVMSQFSAAVADTIGSGGLLSGLVRGRITTRRAYLVVTAGALALNWATSVFDLVALASRAFAAYYLFQCLSALAVVRTPLARAAVGSLAGLMLLVTLFAISAD